MNIWSRLGLSVGIIAGFCILVTELLQAAVYYEILRWYAFAALTAAGALIGGVGWYLRRQARTTARPTGEQQSESTLGSHLVFWGPVLLAFGIVIWCVPHKPKVETVAAAEVIPPADEPAALAPAATNPPPETAMPELPQFPNLNVQGFVHRPPRNAIIVRGRSYFAGDFIGTAKVFSIKPDTVVLEINGFYKAYPIKP